MRGAFFRIRRKREAKYACGTAPPQYVGIDMQYIFYSKKVIYTFRPRYIIMVGIAAGIVKTEPEEQMYGDVIVPYLRAACPYRAG